MSTNARQAISAPLAAFALTLGLGCATPAAVEPTRAWNQAAVTNLAGELVNRVEKAHAAANTETVDPQAMESVSDSLNNLATLERQSRQLYSALWVR